MTSPLLLNGLSDIASNYDAIFCDIWGVIHNGRAQFTPAYEALKRFKATNKPVILISNSPRPRDNLIGQLALLDIYDDGFSDVVSSGDATREYLRLFAPKGPALVIGNRHELALYEGIDIDISGTAENAAFISCTSPYDDDIETAEDYRDLLGICAKRKITMICANPDRLVQRGDKIITCAGALADLYIELGGEVIMAGKPYEPIYELCYKALSDLTGKHIDKSRILAIGDGLQTDVIGANRQDLDLIFIAAGIHATQAIDTNGRLDPQLLNELLAKENAKARFVATGLNW